MILDSSAILAIVRREPGFEALIGKMDGADTLGIGAPTLVETGIVLEARFEFDSSAILERFLRDFEIATVLFGDDHWREAIEAFRRFGRGRHAANLNFGDCMTYAVGRLSAEPLLFVGDDFSKTDLERA